MVSLNRNIVGYNKYLLVITVVVVVRLHCFDTVGWAAGRASGPQQNLGEMVEVSTS